MKKDKEGYFGKEDWPEWVYIYGHWNVHNILGPLKETVQTDLKFGQSHSGRKDQTNLVELVIEINKGMEEFFKATSQYTIVLELFQLLCFLALAAFSNSRGLGVNHRRPHNNFQTFTLNSKAQKYSQ